MGLICNPWTWLNKARLGKAYPYSAWHGVSILSWTRPDRARQFRSEPGSARRPLAAHSATVLGPAWHGMVHQKFSRTRRFWADRTQARQGTAVHFQAGLVAAELGCTRHGMVFNRSSRGAAALGHTWRICSWFSAAILGAARLGRARHGSPIFARTWRGKA